jgi:hypothetical protein
VSVHVLRRRQLPNRPPPTRLRTIMRLEPTGVTDGWQGITIARRLSRKRVMSMTESQAIDACQRTAVQRRRRLGPRILAHLVTGDVPNVPAPQHLLGHWLVVFKGPPGLDTDDHFWVNDTTGSVIWQNGPPSWWVQLLAASVALIVRPVVYLADRMSDAWEVLRLPRCPHCRGKLRTNRAQQCRWCGKSWHNEERDITSRCT